jgi:very-short-patch-repair endonuclease
MTIRYDPHLKDYARRLRRSMTDAENRMWHFLRNNQLDNIRFYRQRPIGHYIVDFVSLKKKIIIEIDGSQHYQPGQQAKDKKRDAFLSSLGYRIIRWSDRDVLTNMEGCIQYILYVSKKSPPPPSLKKRELNLFI